MKDETKPGIALILSFGALMLVVTLSGCALHYSR
jgi:hypothetical protein